MMVVMPVALPDVLAFRKKTGADRFDEMWEGVLHMVPAPNNAHQDLAGDLQTFLKVHWAKPIKAKVFHEVNLASIGGWPNDYRIPDLLLLTRDRFDIDRIEYFEGAPNAVIEFHSPGDEAYEKLPFYAKLGVPEVWIIHRDTREPEMRLLRKRCYRKRRANRAGWIESPGIGIELRRSKTGKLAVRLAANHAIHAELPED